MNGCLCSCPDLTDSSRLNPANEKIPLVSHTHGSMVHYGASDCKPQTLLTFSTGLWRHQVTTVGLRDRSEQRKREPGLGRNGTHVTALRI